MNPADKGDRGDGRPFAWVLNLDADDELARPEGYAPTATMQDLVRRMAARIPGLVQEGDVVLAPAASAGSTGAVEAGLADADQFEGRAWCPTPGALARLERAGVQVPAAPPLDVLQRVNHRRFGGELGPTLPGARFVSTAAELADAIASGPFEEWLAKRPFTMAGRGRCRIRRTGMGERERRWVERSLRELDGLWVEPWVERELDLGAHGFLARDGGLRRGVVTRQECDASGAWVRSSVLEEEASEPSRDARRSPDVDDEWLPELQAELGRVAGALRVAGYFGPFGIDGFVWRDPSGARRLNPRCDVNARYSMGWAVGMRGLRV